ncbi:uncharacterized protein EV420DRAFT_1716622 [Desarmillaria tabescens]|uniref:F-box domain-containing protein n=1 Tax=Armillaria tabescens TaxID=1929756 RepID=A0AA39JQA4_ARMTA|nr:uncharacterized protein EV420DRAFT_1716622 [Desarmillaria tabescens]KAK0445995.1 hypothetical protein EV420DRAFT_1716622 [Desarmillaria tabescens]
MLKIPAITGTSYAIVYSATCQTDLVRAVAKPVSIVQAHLLPTIFCFLRFATQCRASPAAIADSSIPFPSSHSQLKAIQNSDSLIYQVLRGSRPLLDVEYVSTKDEIAKLERLQSWYDAQFRDIQLHRSTVLKALENRKSIYAPIRRLPRDLLIEVFHSVCDTWWQGADEDELRDSLDLSGPLWALSRVCGLWRDTLHTSPASWARCVAVKTPFSKHAPKILQTCLEHTGEHPLTLQALCDSDMPTEAGEIISLLAQTCYRWKNVYICTSTHHLESISPHLPILQVIQIDITDDDHNKCRWDICLNAPRLWQATLFSQGISQVRLPPGITHYP